MPAAQTVSTTDTEFDFNMFDTAPVAVHTNDSRVSNFSSLTPKAGRATRSKVANRVGSDLELDFNPFN